MAGMNKDEKLNILTVSEFLEKHNYLIFVNKKNLWSKENYNDDYYYMFTEEKLIYVSYSFYLNGFMGFKTSLGHIDVAYRDGISEYEAYNQKIKEVKEEIANEKVSESIYEKGMNFIKELKRAQKLMPKYKKSEVIVEEFDFNKYISKGLYVTNIEELKNKYLVVDVETNGLRRSNDDLLSISIYDPTTGYCYNRYLPLDRQPLVLTTHINGITNEDLSNCQHITQEEYDKLVDFFDMNNKILLSYSGDGLFDVMFINKYLERRGIKGFENFKFENIKNKVPNPGYFVRGKLSKDNLCNAMGIEGVLDVHNGLNDCILEWKLYERIYKNDMFFVGDSLYKYNSDYIIPITYLNKYPNLAKCADITLPMIEATSSEIYSYSLPKEILKRVRKFETNITGVTIEHLINSMLDVKTADSYEFCLENRKKIEFVGNIGTDIHEIPVTLSKDGYVEALNDQDAEFINDVNNVTSEIKKGINPLIEFIRKEIFKDEKIYSQELCFSKDKKLMALADLSSSTSILEIKTYSIFNSSNGEIRNDLLNQLYVQSKGRNVYVLTMEYIYNNRNILSEVNIKIHRIDLVVSGQEKVSKLGRFERLILENLIKNPSISKVEMSKIINISKTTTSFFFSELISKGYITKEDLFDRRSSWKVLKDLDGNDIK